MVDYARLEPKTAVDRLLINERSGWPYVRGGDTDTYDHPAGVDHPGKGSDLAPMLPEFGPMVIYAKTEPASWFRRSDRRQN